MRQLACSRVLILDPEVYLHTKNALKLEKKD